MSLGFSDVVALLGRMNELSNGAGDPEVLANHFVSKIHAMRLPRFAQLHIADVARRIAEKLEPPTPSPIPYRPPTVTERR